MNQVHRFAVNGLISLALILAGCNQRPNIALVKVDGTVTLNDEPLANAKVNFYPMASGSAKFVEESHAVTDSDGRFVLWGVHGKEGAMPGQHKVVISKMVGKNGEDLPEESDPAILLGVAKELLAPKYSSPVDSELTAEVPDEGGTIELELKSK